MTALMAALVLASLQGSTGEGFESSFKISFGFGIEFPSMGDEDLFAEEMNASGVSFDLDEVSTAGTIDLTVDASERFKLRGGLGFGGFDGAYSEEHSDMTDLFLAIFTLGFSTLFDSDEEVIDLHDSYLSVEAEGYYVIARSPGASFSAGGGPVFAFAKRSLDSPLTSNEATGSSVGFLGTLRVEQEGGGNLLGLPVRLYAEGGYRYSKVALDESEDFELDFSGPFVRAGIGLQFK
jgi:hypothetical protein